MADEESQITEGIEHEIEGMRRVEQQVVEFAARRHESLLKALTSPSYRKHGERILDKFRLWQLPAMGDLLHQQPICGCMLV